MPTLRVTTDTLNVRRTPDTSSASNIITQIRRDFEVELLASATHPSFHFVRFEQAGRLIEGWVSKALVAAVPEPIPDDDRREPVEDPIRPDRLGVPQFVRVTAATLNVRSTPDSTSSANIIAQIRRDQEVELVPNLLHADFHNVRFLVSGRTVQGWVSKRLVAPVEPPRLPRFRVIADTINVRSTPDGASTTNILTQLRRGDEVDALPGQPNPDWLNVSFAQTGKINEGWVSRRLVVSTSAPTELLWRSGVNMREFIFYGTSAMPHTRVELQEAQLRRLKELGVKVVRIFAAHQDFSAVQVSGLLKTALNKLNAHGIQAIVCLNDSLTGQRLFVPGNQEFHTEVHGHLTRRYWHDRLYRRHFKPYAETVVRAVADHPALLMVELGNEYAIHPQPATDDDAMAFIAFAQEMGGSIKQIAPRVLVTTGLVNSNHIAGAGKHALYARRLYELPVIDAVSIHYYQHDGEREKAPVDISIARDLKKPWFVGEIGMERGTGNRRDYYDGEIGGWKREGAFTVLPWAFYAEPGDVGVCDIYGMGPIHGDFDDLCGVLTRYRA